MLSTAPPLPLSPSYFLPIALMCFFVPFCPVLSSLGGDSLSAMLCSRSHSAPLAVTASVVRDSPPRAFSFKILSRRRGPEDVQHLHSTLPHRPTDRPTDRGRRRFFSLKYAPPCLLLSLVSRIVPPESQVLQETRASSPLLVLKRIFILCARAPTEAAAVAARLPSLPAGCRCRGCSFSL